MIDDPAKLGGEDGDDAAIDEYCVGLRRWVTPEEWSSVADEAALARGMSGARKSRYVEFFCLGASDTMSRMVDCERDQ